MKDKIFGILQRVGRSFMLPIALLPVAGLFLGIGSSFTNETMLETYGLMGVLGPGTVLNSILNVMNAAGSIVFDNLALIFAIGVAIGMAKKEKEVAALAGAIAFFIMHASISAMIQNFGAPQMDGAVATVCGINTLQMGVFGGILVGLGVAALHNKFYRIELPQVLSFFGGTRFVPIVSAIVYLIVGIGMYFVWPIVQGGIYALGDLVLRSGYAGTWLYGFIERALIPFGLHHVFYLPFWQTALGGSLEVAGTVVEGAQNIFFAQLADPTIEHYAVSACRFMSGKFPLMIFGLPGAALAMYHCAKPENRKQVGGLLISAALTAMLTGITEPLEFTFLFVALPLYGVHCVLAGLSYMLMHIFGVAVGMTFSGGIIDLTLFGIMQGNAKTSWIWVVVVGVVYFVLYYLVFSFMIRKFDYQTPGRGEAENKLYTRADVNAAKEAQKSTGGSDALSAQIVAGLGGKANISDVDCCATRLRMTVYDANKVDDATLKATGASGVIHKGQGVQVIYGPRVTVIKSNLEDYLEHGGDTVVSATPSVPEKQEEQPVKRKKESLLTVYAPLNGKLIPLNEVQDDVFSEGMLGNGAAIEPTEGKVVAPCDCEVVNVFDTKHAIGLAAGDVELLIHIGIDTVRLNGEGYDIKVKVGDQLKKGDLIGTFDMEAIKKAGYPVTTPIIVTNSDDFAEVMMQQSGEVACGDTILTIC